MGTKGTAPARRRGSKQDEPDPADTEAIEGTAEEVPPPEEPAAEEPSGTELVIVDRDGQSVAQVLDAHDEQLIVRELQRRALKVMLYDFSQDGQQIVDLSYQGVNEAIRVMNATGKARIKIDPASLQTESVTEDVGNGPEPCWQATVYAHDSSTDYGQFGTYTQPKRIKLRAQTAQRKRNNGQHVADDNTVADKFSRQKAINKAQRNALRVMIPEAVRQTLIAQYRGDPETIRQIQAGAGAASIAELPPPLTDEQAESQKAEARRLYDRLHDLAPLEVLPAQFHAYLTRAEHSHDRLDEFLGYLRDKIRQAEEDLTND